MLLVSGVMFGHGVENHDSEQAQQSYPDQHVKSDQQ